MLNRLTFLRVSHVMTMEKRSTEAERSSVVDKLSNPPLLGGTARGEAL